MENKYFVFVISSGYEGSTESFTDKEKAVKYAEEFINAGDYVQIVYGKEIFSNA